MEPLGTAFDGNGTEQSSTWLDTGTAGVEISHLMDDLSIDTAYHWRLRLRYHPATTPFQAYSRCRQPAGVGQRGRVISTFAYNGLGQRTSQTVGGTTTEYVLDTSAGLSASVAGGLPEVIVATSGGASTYYVQVSGQILAQYGTGAWAYTLPDHLGSVRQLTRAGGQVTLAQGDDPFGVLFESAGSWALDCYLGRVGFAVGSTQSARLGSVDICTFPEVRFVVCCGILGRKYSNVNTA